MNNFPILEFDPDIRRITAQKYLKKIDIAEHCVLCFFQDVVNELKEAGKLRLIYTLASEMGPRPVYEMDVDGQRLALCHPGVGAPLAAGFLEELIALGCTKFVACGGCGVLDGEIALGHVIVPNTAVRDEGTSYHYLPPSREVSASDTAVAAIETTLSKHHIPHRVGKTCDHRWALPRNPSQDGTAQSRRLSRCRNGSRRLLRRRPIPRRHLRPTPLRWRRLDGRRMGSPRLAQTILHPRPSLLAGSRICFDVIEVFWCQVIE